MLWFRQHVLRRFASGERGATVVEYGVIVALFVAGMFGAVTLLRASLSTGSVAAENKVGAPRSQMAAPTNASFSAPSCSAGQVVSASGTCTSGITYCQTIGLGYNSTSNSCTPCTGGNVLSSAGTCQPGVTACPAMGKWYNSATGVCDPSYAGTCVGDQTYNSTTNRCIQPTCGSGTWLNASAGKCEAKAVCVGAQVWNSLNNQCVEPTCQPPNVLNPTTHTCVPGVTYCSALSPARWYNQVDVTCDPITTCTNPSLPYDSGTNTCKATSTNCAALIPPRYYNSSGAGSCDVIPTCTNPSLPYDSGTNTCKATSTNCAAAGRWYNSSGAGSCDVIPTCTTAWYNSTNNTCTSYGGSCSGTQVWSKTTSNCVASPAPTVTTGTADNDNGAQQFDIFNGAIYASAPYTVSITITQCSGVSGVSCSASGSVITVTPGSTTATGTVTIRYTFRITWPTGASSSDISNASTSKTLSITMTN